MLSAIWRLFAGFPAVAPVDAGVALHYIWVNRNPRPAGRDSPRAPLCRVPLTGLDRAFANARAYPGAAINLWIDYDRLDDMSRFFVESHVHNSAPPNVTLRRLGDVPAYAALPAAVTRDIWALVDYARLLVMAHAFDTMDEGIMVYADLDVADVRLDDARAARCLARHGMFFGRTIEENSMIENSFMAFARGAGEMFLKDELIPRTRDDARRGANGFAAMTGALQDYGQKHNIRDIKNRLSGPRAERTGTVLPADPLYRACGLN